MLRGKVKALSLVAKAVLVLVCLVLIIPGVIRLYPSLIGADSSYIVLGGSMEPTLNPGDLTFTEKVETAEIELGDVVAVKTDSGIYTHRVIEKKESDEGILFRLKGDANEDPDSSYVNGSEIIGKTSFSLPMGYLYTKNGYILAVVTPLMLLAVAQAVKINKLYDTRKRRRGGLKAILLGKGGRRRRKFSILDTISILLLLILVAGGTNMIAPYFTVGSAGFFTDMESSSSNVIGAATWMVSSSITCSVSPNPTVNLGENVTVLGSIIPARSGVAVTLTYGWNGTTMTRTVETNGDGAYYDTFTPNEVGFWTIKASWEGDSNYFGASSNIVTVSVTELKEE